MKKIAIFIVVLFCVSMLFAEEENEILGSYKDKDGNTLLITSMECTLNGTSSFPILIGQKSVDQGLTMLGGISYYIKPCYSYNNKRATLTNILLQYGDNQILGINIFDYDVINKTMKFTNWNIISVGTVGVISLEFTKE